MRTTLVAGLIGAMERNLARGQMDFALFEVGQIFLPTSEPLPEERRRVAGLLVGRREGWLKPGSPFDVFDVKGAVEGLLAAVGYEAQYEAGEERWLHPGLQGRVAVDGRHVGVFGELHPGVSRRLALQARAFIFEIDLDALGPAKPVRLRELPKFPPVVRDLSFFVAESVSARFIAETIERLRDTLCVSVQVVEDYREPGKVPPGEKGMLWSLTYRAPDRTLTDSEVDERHAALRVRLEETLHIALR